MARCAVITSGRIAADHVAALERLHSEVTIDRRCADLAEVVAAARTGRADAALIIGATEELTESTISELLRDISTIVAISELQTERHRLAQLGLSTFNDDVAASVLARALQSERSPQLEDPLHGVATEDAEFAALIEAQGLALPEGREEHSVDPRTGFSGGVTAVWGPSGAPGRTTLAVNLAAELALSGRAVLLIDADTYAASAAVQLGLIEESAGIAQVCRAAEFGSLDSEILLRATAGVDVAHARCDVLTGLPRSHRWTELRPRAFEKVLSMCRSRYDHVVVDCASEIGADQEWGYEQPAVQRNSATQTVLSSADQVLAVGSPDPVGFSRLIKAVQHLGEDLPQAPPPQVVVNKLRKDVVGRSPRRQLTDAWLELGQQSPIAAFLPWEPAVCDAALRSGQVLAESASDSVLRRQIAALAGIEVRGRRRRFGRSAVSGRRSRRRRPAELSTGVPGAINER
ncbi:AAA family ATPase [Nesterenkonia haasae]|uniref:AAA family ATPase n=1 Tax=Nesterenkonia haasae TaxID=2587813 RepID=UPI0013920998|nr:AAA family ATPase [Nesterenkonia haasae]NDK31340.1 chromosome partitioning protein [Nesterenkonia haasae]